MGDEDDTRPSMPVFTFHDEHEQLAKTAYTTYLAQMNVVGFKTPDNALPPGPYDKLDPRLRECWRQAIVSVLRKIQGGFKTPMPSKFRAHQHYFAEADLTIRIHPPLRSDFLEFDSWLGQPTEDEEAERTRHTVVFEESDGGA